MFSTLYKIETFILAYLKLSSANASDLAQSKLLLFGEVTYIFASKALSQMKNWMLLIMIVSVIGRVENIFGKEENGG